MKFSKPTLFIALVFCFTMSAQAQDEEERNLKFLLGMGVEFGGDEVAEVFFQGGGNQSVNAGQGLSGHGGLEYSIPGLEELRIRGTVGYKYVTTAADNANITLTRIPIHGTVNYVVKDAIRIGAGIASHQSIKFSGDGLAPDIDFQSASGPIFEVAYKWVGVSYTSMTYEDEGGNMYDASSIGFTFYGTF